MSDKNTPTATTVEHVTEMMEMEFSSDTVLKRFVAAVQHIPLRLVAASATEFKQKAVGINDFMREVAGPLRCHGLLLSAQLQSVEPWIVETTEFMSEEGEKVTNTQSVIRFEFNMNITDFHGNPLWEDEAWIAIQRNIGSDKRPEFWPGKALAYISKYWLGRRLGIDFGEEPDSDPDTEISVQPAKKRAGSKQAARKKSAQGKSSVTWGAMYGRWVDALGKEATDELWGVRKKDDTLMDEGVATGAEEKLAELMSERSRAAEKAGEEPFDVTEPQNTASESTTEPETAAPVVPDTQWTFAEAVAAVIKLSTDPAVTWADVKGQIAGLGGGEIPEGLAAAPPETPLEEVQHLVMAHFDGLEDVLDPTGEPAEPAADEPAPLDDDEVSPPPEDE